MCIFIPEKQNNAKKKRCAELENVKDRNYENHTVFF